ncbi:BppU family phage baseplate upper protein [Limosilactobacillus sp. BG-MG3-A]|uniref:BppU family phage baseplate upper protein n=1 Tax=Limosilactobacillus agrestis TaxID=2759748 RepID=A0A7W3UIF3_9LACO|nr:BppU family phage baseplate upper protein [Limosilactobacillus agrestis]MBB1096176.1 BppU family phage baseplate upper protein [Limosilactobacillus agrestis]
MSELFLPKDYTSENVPTSENNPDIIYLDLYKPRTVYYNMRSTFNGRQLDKDVPLKVQLGYGHKPLNLNNIKDIRFTAAKPDGTGVQTIGEYKIFNPIAGLVYVTIPAATFSATGMLYFNLQVITNEEQLLSSNTCYFEVEASFARAVFNAGNYDTEIETAKKQALANIEKFNSNVNSRLESANNLAQGIENSNHVLARAVDDNANAVRAGLAPTNGGANVFTGPNTFQQLLTLAGGLNLSNKLKVNGTDIDLPQMLKNLNDAIDKLNHIFDGDGIGADTDFNNLENGIHLLYVTQKTVGKGHNFPVLDNSKDNENVSMYGVLFQFGNKNKFPVAFQLYFNVAGSTDSSIYLRQKAGNNNGDWGDWSNWTVNK